MPTLNLTTAALSLLLLSNQSQSPPPDPTGNFTPGEAARVVAQYRRERPRCIKRDADVIRREIDDLEDKRREVRKDKSLRPDQRNARSAAILDQIRTKRAELRDVMRGRTEPLPKNLIYSGSWEARSTSGHRLAGEPPIALAKGAFGMIDDGLGGRLGRYEPFRNPDAPFKLRYTHTIYTVKLEKHQANDPHALNTPAHAAEYEYVQSSEKEVRRSEIPFFIRGITTANTSVDPPVYTVRPEYRGDNLFTHPFIVTHYDDVADPPVIILEPFDLEVFRTRAAESQ